MKITILHAIPLLAVACLTITLPGWKRIGLADAPRMKTRPALNLRRERAPVPTESPAESEQTDSLASGLAYDLVDLGTLGGPSSCAYGVNNAGDVVGAAVTATGAKHAFLYRDGVMRDLGSLGGNASIARGINDAGEVVGEIQGLRRTNRPFVYRGGEMRGVEDFRGRFSSAWSISRSGRLVGEFYDPDRRRNRAFCWFPPETVIRLGTLGGSDSRAFATNDAGQIVGVSATRYDWSQHAFLWQDGEMSDLGTLGGNDSEARAINSLGQIVGESCTAGGDEHAFLYSGGTMTDLGTLGGNTSVAQGINDAGTVVGWAAGMGSHAFLWQAGKMWDLNRLISPSHGWLLSTAFAINDKDQIVGCGIVNGESHAFLLTPNRGPASRRPRPRLQDAARPQPPRPATPYGAVKEQPPVFRPGGA